MSKLPGNPFGRKQQPGTGLLQEQGVRSDDYLEDEPAAPEPTRSAASQPGVPVAPPPPVQAAPLPPPPPPVAMGVPLSAGAAPDMSDATTGAWGTQRPAQGVWGLSSSDSGPAGYPPPSYSSGAYAPPTYSQQAAWAGPSDQPQYASFEQSAAAAQPPLRCAGWGEQWVLFLCGIIIWPLWYVGVIWHCVRREKDPRQRTPFILNCVASFVFTIIWIAIVVRATSGWYCNESGCWW